jgi:hypothetical protein
MKTALPEPDVTVAVFEYGCARAGRSLEDIVKATRFLQMQNDGSSS